MGADFWYGVGSAFCLVVFLGFVGVFALAAYLSKHNIPF